MLIIVVVGGAEVSAGEEFGLAGYSDFVNKFWSCTYLAKALSFI